MSKAGVLVLSTHNRKANTMKRNVSESDIKDQPIEKFEYLEVEQHKHTGKWIYTYFIHLMNGKIISVEPTNISLVDNADLRNLKIKSDFPSQVIDGNSNLVGESIQTVISHLVPQEDSTKDSMTLYGLLVSSGRVVTNAYQAGGGSILHVESLKGFLRHIPGPWKNEWSGTELS